MTRLFFNIIILGTASRRLPELHGYRSRRHPDQPPPAPPRIAPRRRQLPPTFAQDEELRRIGSRRQGHLLSPGSLPTFGQPRSIMVRSQADEQKINTKLQIRNRKFSYSMLE